MKEYTDDQSFKRPKLHEDDEDQPDIVKSFKSKFQQLEAKSAKVAFKRNTIKPEANENESESSSSSDDDQDSSSDSDDSNNSKSKKISISLRRFQNAYNNV